MKLTAVQQKFVLHWGEMGLRWGINRTVAQIHALLYLAPGPLPADEICEVLAVARSNASVSLRELQNWGLIKVTHVLGDRRDHFGCVTRDVWQMFRAILNERKKREIDPTIEMLAACVAQAKHGGAAEELTRERLSAIKDFFETMTAWYDQIDALPTSGVVKFVKAAEKVRRLLGIGAS